MKFEIKKELPILIIVAIPFVYLYTIWNKLPNKVPLPWDINGEVNRYGDKSELILIPFILPFLVYVIFLLIPLIDPKGKIKKMGRKFQSLKLILTLAMSLLAIFIIHSALFKEMANPNVILLGIGILYLVLGNYFKTIKPNYFIGIRTPWTLESEQVWTDTHKMAGKLWFVGGFLVVIFSLVLNYQLNMKIFLAITLVITVVPIIYSYLAFKSHKKHHLNT